MSFQVEDTGKWRDDKQSLCNISYIHCSLVKVYFIHIHNKFSLRNIGKYMICYIPFCISN